MDIYELLLMRANELYPGKVWLTEENLAVILEVRPSTIKSYYKRPEDKQPPRLVIGKEMKFPKERVLEWFVKVQGRGLSV